MLSDRALVLFLRSETRRFSLDQASEDVLS